MSLRPGIKPFVQSELSKLLAQRGPADLAPAKSHNAEDIVAVASHSFSRVCADKSRFHLGA